MLLEEGYEAFGPGIRRAMTAFCRDVDAAEDALQHAFLQGMKNRALLESMPQGAMRAWLTAAARNHLIDLARRRTRLVVGLAEDIPAQAPDPTDQLLARQLIDTLPQPLAQVVTLKYYGGMNATEIGQALELPPATVRTRLKKAMDLMRERM